jgi:hypothetical protein
MLLTGDASLLFHLVSDLAARDILGHCADDKEARADARAIAHRIGTQRPAMVGRKITFRS